jgi:plastocyanin
MRHRLLAFCALTLLAAPLFAAGKDLYLSIGGTTGAFHTDMRIFNPSTTKDIEVTAYLLAVGNVNNAAAQTKVITVAKRQMLVYNDVLTALFSVGGLGGLRLKSDDDFIATQRIYALAADGSTTGQYIPGLDVSTAKKKGVIIQLRHNGTAPGTFRTNVGVVNPNAVEAHVTWRLYDRNNNLVGQPTTETMPPFAVKGPTAIGTPSPELSDAWISYESDQPLFAYASIVDNATADGTLIPNFEDTGVTQVPTSTVKTFEVTLRNGQITISPAPDNIQNGETIKFRIRSEDLEHGFRLNNPSGVALTERLYKPSDGIIEQTVTIPREGTYAYFCTNMSCSPQHNSMYGTFIVGDPGEYEKPGY